MTRMKDCELATLTMTHAVILFRLCMWCSRGTSVIDIPSRESQSRRTEPGDRVTSTPSQEIDETERDGRRYRRARRYESDPKWTGRERMRRDRGISGLELRVLIPARVQLHHVPTPSSSCLSRQMAHPMLSPLHTASAFALSMHQSTSRSHTPFAHILRLSSPSFLDGVLSLDHGAPLYAIDTTDRHTQLSRCTPACDMHAVGSIVWSATEHRVQLHDAAPVSARTFLRASRSPLSSPGTRKFRHHGTSYRWRRASRNGSLQLTTGCSGDRITVAIYEPAHLTSRPKLRVFDPFAQDLALLDAIVLSAILLVEQPPAAAPAATSQAYTQRRSLTTTSSVEPQSPGALPRYSVLADAFADPLPLSTSQSDVKDCTLFISIDDTPASPAPSRLSLDTSYMTPSVFASSPATSPVSSSDAWSARPWAVPQARSTWQSLDLDLGWDFDRKSSSQHQQRDTLEAAALVPITDSLSGYKSAAIVGDEPEPPPPYDEHEWTVRIPAHRSAKI